MSNNEKILMIAQRIFKDKNLQLSNALHDADGYDSMVHVRFLIDLEEAFGVEIADSDILRNTTLREVSEVIRSKQGEK